MSLDGFSFFASALELDKILTGCRIDKIFQPDKNNIYLTVRGMRESHFIHISINSRFPAINIVNKLPENPPVPPAFCMLLRKQLEGGRIAKIRHVNMDRIIAIDIDILVGLGKIVTKTLYVELAGKYSNVILTDEMNVVIEAIRRLGPNNSRVRTILPNHLYVPLPQTGFNILTESSPFLKSIHSMPEQEIFQALLKQAAGFGPVSVHTLLYNANIAENNLIKNLTATDWQSLQTAISSLQEIFHTKNFTPSLAINERGKILAAAAFPLQYLTAESKIITFSSMSAMIEYAQKLQPVSSSLGEQYKKLVQNELKKLRNKKIKLGAELNMTENAEKYKIWADNLMTYQYRLQDHLEKEITVPNIYSANGEDITISMDKKYTIIQNMQRYYQKYDKLKRAKIMIKEQIDICHTEINYLESIENSLNTSSSLSDLEQIKSELIKAGYLRPQKAKYAVPPAAKHWQFTLPNGTILLAGKNNIQNDKITFKLSQPHDIWLHTKDIPGSHVIIRTENGNVDAETLEQAAILAATLSKASNSSNVPVDYTLCKFVKKPSGAKPGFVNFTHQKTLFVQPDKELLKQLINNA